LGEWLTTMASHLPDADGLSAVERQEQEAKVAVAVLVV